MPLGTSCLTEMPQPMPQLSCPSNGSDNCCLKELCEPQQKSGTWKCLHFLRLCCPVLSNAVAMSRAVLCLVMSGSYDPMGCSLSGASPPGDSPGRNTGVGLHTLLQGIFPTQGLNPGLPQYRWILYHLSHQGSPSKYCISSITDGDLTF